MRGKWRGAGPPLVERTMERPNWGLVRWFSPVFVPGKYCRPELE